MRWRLGAVLLFLTTMAWGHGGDETGLPYAKKAQIESYARYIVTQQVRRGELPSSWENAVLEHVGQADYQFQREWVVAFRNGQESAPRRQLFVFFDLQGGYLGSNFTRK
jgi:hypothetical protein